jgi:hypothetical protein
MADPETKDEEIIDGVDETETDGGTESEQSEVGDDSEDAPEGDGTEAEGQEVEAKPSRAETRFQKLANEAKEAREEAAQARREIAEFKGQQRQQAQQESPDQVAQRLALMTPEERLEYKLDQAERRNSQTMANMQFQMQDTGDKSAFHALCASDSTAARYKDKVESELSRLRSQGQNVSREALFTYMFGQDVRSKSGAARAKQGKDGERRLQRQKVAPGNSRGDSQPAKRGEKSLEEKLENVTF